MKTTLITPFKDLMFITGILLIALSLGIFLLPDADSFQARVDSFFGIFFFNYGISIVYFIVILINSFYKHRWKIFNNRIEYTFMWLVLCFISCFSLNREIRIFPDSVRWLEVYLTASCVILVLSAFRHYFKSWMRYLYFLLVGISFTLFLYYAVYLVPYYAIGIMAFWFFGLSLHAFIPLVVIVYVLMFVYRSAIENKKLAVSFSAGALIPLAIMSYNLYEWIGIKNKINHAYNQTIIEDESKLPAWVRVSREINFNWFTERYLKTDLMYASSNGTDNFFWADFTRSGFSSEAKHDPLVVTASLFCGKGELSHDERIKILEAMYDSRHQAQEQLWSGNNLETSNLISNIRIYPEYRLAYTEKIISIQNSIDKNTWRTQQEAIYTFHLPEGSAVTSLSLWINGREEKAHLTTKGKADTAYKTIVGVESRDPSVVHWQEGNTVSVRVFPCTPDENRRFKLGVTSPLRKEENKLVYENIWFDGPAAKNATETIKLDFTSKPQNLDLPFSFDDGKGNSLSYEGDYTSYWEVKLESPRISPASFSFDSLSYHLENYEKVYQPFDAKDVYLDINKTWTKNDFDEIWQAVKSKNVYVFDENIEKLTEENKNEVFAYLNSYNFSIFPVYEIKDPGQSLLVSKGTNASPNLSDLKGSAFSDALSGYLKDNAGIRLFNIGSTLSPFMKTLKELRVFQYDFGDAESLVKLINEKKFIAGQENENSVIIDNAGLKIVQDSSINSSGAPDHLLRLFCYNDVMKKVNTNYFTPDFVSSSIIAQASKGYVVTPVSSLIVLETKQDYERFGIEKNYNSVMNASMKSSGSVPEPHEWLLIALVFVTALYLWKKPF